MLTTNVRMYVARFASKKKKLVLVLCPSVHWTFLVTKSAAGKSHPFRLGEKAKRNDTGSRSGLLKLQCVDINGSGRYLL